MLDFFTPQVSADRMHPNFKMLLSAACYRPVVDKFLLWAEGFPDRDNKIVTEFQTTFNSVFWEVYLHRLFTELGFSIDYSCKSPDYMLSNGGSRFCVEAVIANNASDEEPEHNHLNWVKSGRLSDITSFNYNSMLRQVNAIESKSKKYLMSYSKNQNVAGKPYVIALGQYDRFGFWTGFDRAIRAVLYSYYVDEQGDVDAPVVSEVWPPVKHLKAIKKRNGADIPLGLFCDSRMSHVSAIMYSNCATIGKLRAGSILDGYKMIFSGARLDRNGRPHKFCQEDLHYSEQIQDGLYVFHNPYASVPLDVSVFRCPFVLQHFFSDEHQHLVIEGVDGFLATRMVSIEPNG